MRIFVPRELHPTERRVPLLPSGAAKLAKIGAEIEVEQGLGAALHCEDLEYLNAGAKISTDRVGSLSGAEMVLRLRKPALDEVELLKKGCVHASFLDPFNERELVLRLAAAGVTAISMEMIPNGRGPEDGRAQFASKPEWLCRDRPGGRAQQPDFSNAYHPGGND